MEDDFDISKYFWKYFFTYQWTWLWFFVVDYLDRN